MKKLYVFAEGYQDKLLLETLIRATKLSDYYKIYIYEYAQKAPNDVSRFIQIVKQMPADFIFLADLDFELCITKKKEKLIKKYQVLSPEKIQIAKMEIESWYLAGLDKKASQELGLKYLPNTDAVTKEEFCNLKPKGYISKIVFLEDIRKRFSVEVASSKNTSFRYFMEKHIRQLLT